MRRPTRDDRGTSTLEVAGLAPLVALLIVILIHAAVALYCVTTAQTAARQAARSYSQGGDPFSVVQRSVPSWIHLSGGDVQTYGPGHGVTVKLDVPDVIPYFNLQVERKAVMP